jgi:hypothetical protein
MLIKPKSAADLIDFLGAPGLILIEPRRMRRALPKMDLTTRFDHGGAGYAS